MIDVLFYATEYRPNLSNMIRTAEFYGLKRVYFYDQNDLLKPPHNKVSKSEMDHMARVWTAGAIEFIDVIPVTDVSKFIKNRTGRTIATEVNVNAVSLSDFKFLENDLLIMGPEKNGLPETLLQECNQAVYIPQKGHTNCLNVSSSFSVFLHQMILDTSK